MVGRVPVGEVLDPRTQVVGYPLTVMGHIYMSGGTECAGCTRVPRKMASKYRDSNRLSAKGKVVWGRNWVPLAYMMA